MIMEQVAISYCNAVLTFLSGANDKTVLTDIWLRLIDNHTTNQVINHFTMHFFNKKQHLTVASNYGGTQQSAAAHSYAGSEQQNAARNYGIESSTNTGAGVVVQLPSSFVYDYCCYCGYSFSKVDLVQLPCRHDMCITCHIAK